MSTGESARLAVERQRAIRDLTTRGGSVRVDDLVQRLGVSAATIRRDLADLAQRRQVRRVHGGAMSLAPRLDETVFDNKTALFADEKRRIAEKALTFIQPNDSVFLDGGSTVLRLAGLLRDCAELTVVSNSLRVAMELAGGGPRLLLTGGDLRRISQTLVGPLTAPVLDRLHVDRAFMGTIGLSLDEAMTLTTTDPQEAYTKECVMRQAQEVILLADSSKLGKLSFARFGSLKHVDVLITDSGADPDAIRYLKDNGVRVEAV